MVSSDSVIDRQSRVQLKPLLRPGPDALVSVDRVEDLPKAQTRQLGGDQRAIHSMQDHPISDAFYRGLLPQVPFTKSPLLRAGEAWATGSRGVFLGGGHRCTPAFLSPLFPSRSAVAHLLQMQSQRPREVEGVLCSCPVPGDSGFEPSLTWL